MLPAFHNGCLPPLSLKSSEAAPGKASHHLHPCILNHDQKGLSGYPQRLDDDFPGGPERRLYSADKNHNEAKKRGF